VCRDEHPRAGKGTDLILYDGVCGLCNRGVRFVLKRDRKCVFRFAALQSSAGREILARHGIQLDALDTFYVVQDFGLAGERVLARSSAAIYTAARLGGVWKAVTVLRILPQHVRDFVYDTIARRRYRIFGRYNTCPLPEARYRDRFIDAQNDDAPGAFAARQP
jgi:predicted DCC family thiol-disulfide oxidoreductase YuxK